MVQKRSKQIKITILIILIIALTAGGAVWFINSRSNNENNIPIQEENLDFSAKRLIVVTDVELKETYNATNVNKTNSGKYVLKYATEEDTKKAYESLKQDETIQSVDIDINVKLQEVEPLFITYTSNGLNANSWGLFTMGLDKTQNLINNSTSKNDVIVAVIDSGFDLENEYITSNNLGERIDSRYINAVDNSKDITDDSSHTINEQTVLIGHGTHVGGIILDSTPDNVKILPIKISDSDGEISPTYIVEALRYAIDQGVDVINLSLGAEKQSATIEEEFQALIEEAIQKGITVVAAAGNGDENGIRKTADNVYPVAFDDVIGVAALGTDIITTTNGAINYESYVAAKQSNVSNLSYTSFSNYGKAVDYSAPGQYILSLTPTQSASGVCGLMSGTSQASPHIAATIATLKSYNKDITLAQVNKILEYYSLDLGTTGRDDDYGHGMPCLKNAQECTCNCDTCDKLYCFGCDCDTCLYSLTVDKELDRIEITTNPDKMEYEVGETFDKTGMVVTAIYSDASQETITEYTYSPTGSLTVNDNKIVITYQGKTATLRITVKEAPPAEKTLQKIEITSQPNKLTYNEGEKFDPTGMIVKGIYSDNSDIILSNYDYSPKGNLTKNDTAVIITYQGKTATVNITVQEVKQEERKLERIEITSQPNKTTYTEGEKFDSTGMIITAIYSDGTREIITNYSCFPVTELKQNNNEITVSYTYNGKTVTAKYPIEVKTQTQNNSGNNNNNNSNNGGNNNSGTPIGNNNMNFITVKENDNNNNNKTIPKNTNTDNTIKGGTIANTGLETIIIIPIAIITVIGTVAFINYKRYKDI